MALDYDRATLDHVHPLAKGGTHSPGNVVSACPPCNRLKADMLPAEFFLRHPWAGANFILYARAVHRALNRQARRAVSLACAEARAAWTARVAGTECRCPGGAHGDRRGRRR
jgi:hypothetical protein